MGDPFEYECWEGHLGLPRLNLDEPQVKRMIFQAAAFWLCEVGADGWRLDVAHEISPQFWREFAAVCRTAKPTCVLVGELIHGKHWPLAHVVLAVNLSPMYVCDCSGGTKWCLHSSRSRSLLLLVLSWSSVNLIPPCTEMANIQ